MTCQLNTSKIECEVVNFEQVEYYDCQKLAIFRESAQTDKCHQTLPIDLSSLIHALTMCCQMLAKRSSMFAKMYLKHVELGVVLKCSNLVDLEKYCKFMQIQTTI